LLRACARRSAVARAACHVAMARLANEDARRRLELVLQHVSFRSSDEPVVGLGLRTAATVPARVGGLPRSVARPGVPEPAAGRCCALRTSGQGGAEERTCGEVQACEEVAGEALEAARSKGHKTAGTGGAAAAVARRDLEIPRSRNRTRSALDAAVAGLD
jgi:hypothetical protein